MKARELTIDDKIGGCRRPPRCMASTKDGIPCANYARYETVNGAWVCGVHLRKDER